MNEEKINYRSIFKKKIVLYSIGSINIPMGIELKKIFLGIGGMIFAFLFKFFFLNHIILIKDSRLITVYYITFAFLVIGIFGSDNTWTEGKTVYKFTKDYLSYLFKIKLPKKIFYQDEAKEELQDKVKVLIK